MPSLFLRGEKGRHGGMGLTLEHWLLVWVSPLLLLFLVFGFWFNLLNVIPLSSFLSSSVSGGWRLLGPSRSPASARLRMAELGTESSSWLARCFWAGRHSPCAPGSFVFRSHVGESRKGIRDGPSCFSFLYCVCLSYHIMAWAGWFRTRVSVGFFLSLFSCMGGWMLGWTWRFFRFAR